METQAISGAEAISRPVAPVVAAQPVKPNSLYFAAGPLRKTSLSFVFLLLLPFYASLPAMLYMRVNYGLWGSTVGVAVLALCFTVIMAILYLQLNHAIRAYVTIGAEKVKLNLPRARGATPLLRYDTHIVAFGDIQSVETYRTCHGAPLMPVLMRGAAIVTKQGERIDLGVVNDNDTDTFPIPMIAELLAERAGIKVKDLGTVPRSVRADVARQVFGFSYGTPQVRQLSDAEIAAYNARHRRLVLGVIAVMFVLVSIGIVMDILKAGGTA